MGQRSQGILVGIAVFMAVAMIVGGAIVLARGGGGSTIRGTRGADRLIGTPGPDRILGRGGADVIKGRGGADVLIGGAGGDRITGGFGDDRLIGGPGRDRLRARYQGHDTLDCGGRRDVASVGRAEDGVFDCERLVIPHPDRNGGKR